MAKSSVSDHHFYAKIIDNDNDSNIRPWKRYIMTGKAAFRAIGVVLQFTAQTVCGAQKDDCQEKPQILQITIHADVP